MALSKLFCSCILLIGLLLVGLAHARKHSSCSSGEVKFAHSTQLLVDPLSGATFYQGVIKTCIDNHWSLICSHEWDHIDAKVVCSDLGLSPHGAMAFNGSHHSANLPVVLTDVRCRGDEITLSECDKKIVTAAPDSRGKDWQHFDEEEVKIGSGSGSGSGQSTNECSTNEIAGVLCWTSFQYDICETGDIRFTGGNASNEGVLKVCINNKWGAVCGRDWSSQNSGVACKQLGFSPEGSKLMRGLTGAGELPSFLSRVSCADGHRDGLLDCSYEIGGNESVASCGEAVGLICTGPEPCENGQVRLLGTTGDDIGIVQLCYKNQWNFICDYTWRESEASVVCQQLGYSSKGAEANTFPFNSLPSNNVLDHHLKCNGSESQLFQCIDSHYDNSQSMCQSTLYAGVKCKDQCKENDIIINSLKVYSKTVVYLSICVNGELRPVCDPSWSYDDASIACQTAGMSPYGARTLLIPQTSKYSVGHSLVTAEVYCHGKEKNLSDCNRAEIKGKKTCKAITGAVCLDPNSVISGNCSHGDVRIQLYGKDSLLEICINNLWSGFCYGSEYITDWKMGNIACIQLGYGVQDSSPISPMYGSHNGSAFQMFRKISCHGNESRLLDCIKDTMIKDIEYKYCAPPTGLKCQASPPTVQSITLSNQSLLLPGRKKQLNVTFSCKVTGTGPINVTWNFSGEFSRLNLILKSEVVTAAQSGNYWSNLVVSDVSGVNNGVYSCMASSKHGKDSKGKNLMIKVDPVVSLNATSNHFIEGSHAVLNCTGTGYPSPRLSIWKNGRPMLSANRPTCHAHHTIGAYLCELVLRMRNMTLRDKGIYTCIAAGTSIAWKSIYIDVWSRPQVTAGPRDTIVKINDTVLNATLSCTASGYPTPNVIWYRQRDGRYSEIIRNNSDHKIINVANGNTTVTSSLVMFNVTPAHSGHYWCNGINSIAMAMSSALFIVHKIPSLKMTVDPSDTVLEQSNVTITCTAEEMSLLLNTTINWTKNNQTLPNKRAHQIRTRALGQETIKSTLSLPSSQASQSGLYECTLRTDLNDQVTTSAPVNIEAPLRINFKSDSPIINGHQVQAILAVNKPTTLLTCNIGGMMKDCSSGNVRFDNVSCTHHQSYDQPMLLVVNGTSHLGENVVIKRNFYIDSSNLCSIHLINDGITVSGNSIKVEFAGVGEFRNFRYNLDSVGYHLCSSPLILTDLPSGYHVLKIKPVGCRHKIHKILKYRFSL